MTRLAHATAPRMIHAWLRAGNTGTARQIALALDLRMTSIRNALNCMQADEWVIVARTIELPQGTANIYATATQEPWAPYVKEVQRPVAPAGLIVSALSRRTPLERVWHGVEA